MNQSEKNSMLKTFFHYLPLPWILVGLLAAVFFGFSFSTDPDKADPANQDTSGFPQYYMQNIRTQEFEANGKLRYELTTPVVEHYQMHSQNPGPEDYTSIQHPKILFFEKDNHLGHWKHKKAAANKVATIFI